MGTRAIQSDLEELRLIRQAIRALSNIDVKTQVPRIEWRVGTDPTINRAAERAAAAVIRDQWTRMAFRNAAVAAMQARADAIVAKYPALDLSN